MKKKIYATKKPALQNKKRQLTNIFTCFLFIISVSASAQNPLMLKSPIPGGAGRSIQKIVSTTSGKTFFNTVDNNTHFSDLWGLWTTDGTPVGTQKITLTSPPYPGGSSQGGFISTEATLLTQLDNDKILFAGDNEGGYGEVWVSDGTQSGTFVLEQFIGGASGAPVSNITSFGTSVIYSVVTNDGRLQLHKTDGSYAGTLMAYDFGLYTDYSVAYFKKIGNLVYFELNNNSTKHNEIWRTDGTQAGTHQVKDLGQDYGFASDFMAFNNSIYFITISSTYGDYLWKSDGTNSGTAPLKQISTTFNSDNLFPSYAAVENAMILANNLLYFTANDGTHGKELWKTDGTEAGTGMAFDFYQGATGSNPQWLKVLNNQLYFAANSSFFPQGTMLYFYNGTQFSQPIGNSVTNPSNFAIQNNTILFNALRNGSEGNELWATGGSTPNTIEIANINPGINLSSNPSLISVAGNDAYFAASFDANGDGIDDPCIYKYMAPQKIWTGSVSTDSQDGNNWFPAGVPAQTDNVLLPNNPANSFSNPFLFCNDFINNGSTVNVGNGLVLINGNFYNAGIINNPAQNDFYNGVFGIVSSGNTNTIHFSGNIGTYIGQLTLSGGSNMQLTTNAYFPALRVEGADSIYLGDYSLTVDNYTLQKPTIITNGAGKLFMPVGSSPVTFNLTSPVTITNTGTYDYFGVNVKDGVYSNGTTGNLVGSEVVNKTWNIEEQTLGGSNATITLQWNAADELPGFVRNNVYLNHYTSGAWDSGTPGAASGTGPYAFSRSGITSFSPFTVSSSTSALPVNLISFTVNKLENTVQLNWQTISEKNFSFFDVERSNDGTQFSKLGEVPASVNNSSAKNYSYTDYTPVSGTDFYRLKMVDADGKFTYSKIVAIRFNGNNNALQIFPNPAKNVLHVQITGSNENAVLQIIDLTGRKVKEQRISVNGTTSVSVDINDFPKGMYTLLLKTNSKTAHQKFVKN